MKKFSVTVAAVVLLAAGAHADDSPVFKTPMDKVNYGIGVEMGRNFRNQGVEVNFDLVVQGLKDGLSGGKLLIPEKELHAIMLSFQNELRQKQSVAKRIAALDNRKKGEAFLAENKVRPGIVTLPSGVQYQVLKAGNGRKPTDADMAECLYRGTLIDGTEFDGTPPEHLAVLQVSALIPGWREAMKLMPAGSKWQVFIPSALAYGERGKGNTIGPNELLIIEIELVAVK